MIKNVKFFLLGAALALSQLAISMEISKGYSEGKIDLKSGETLEGMIAPMADSRQTNVLFKSTLESDPLLIKHRSIKSMEKAGIVLIPKQINWEGKSVHAYLEEKLDGSYALYKAHFYGRVKRGKNNSSYELQSVWVVKSPIKGFVVLGKNVKASDLNLALTHPKNELKLEENPIDENQLVEVIRSHNEKIQL